MVTWLRRWRMALHLARRDCVRSKGRTALVVAMVSLPLMAAACGFTMFRSSYPGDEVFVRQTLGSTVQAKIDVQSVQLTQDVRGETSFGQLLQDPPSRQDALASIRSVVPAGDTVEEAVTAEVRSQSDDGAVGRDPFTEVATSVVASYGDVVQGTWGSAPGEAVVSKWYLRALGIAIGDTVTVEWSRGMPAVPVRITGVIDAPHGMPFPGLVAIPGTLPPQWNQAQADATYFVTGPQPVAWSAAAALNQEGMVLVSRDAVLNPPAGAPVGRGPYGNMSTAGSQGLIIAAVVVAVLLLEVTMIIGPAFAVGARRSRRTLALMGASGADPRQLRRVVIASGVFQGALAATVGIVLGVIVAGVLYRTVDLDMPNFVIPWELMALTAILGVLVGAAAAWLPARAAARSDLVAALAGRAPTPLSSRRTGWVGATVFALGVGGLVAGSVAALSWLAAVGAFLALVGIITASGVMVSAAARLAPHLGVASRLALRDAARHRSRTAPALAAVIACAAGATLTLVYLDASQSAQEELWVQAAAPGRIVIGAHAGDSSLGDLDTEMQAMVAAATQQYPGAQFFPVQTAAHTDGDVQWMVSPVEDRDACSDKAIASSRWVANYCRPDGRSGFTVGAWQLDLGVRVDDGTVMRALGFPGGEEAARALEQGKVLTHNPLAIGADGIVRLQVVGCSASQCPADTIKEVAVPGHYVPWISSEYELVLAPQVARELGLDQVTTIGYVGVPAQALGQEDQRTVQALAGHNTSLFVYLTSEPSDQGRTTSFIIVAVALLVAAGATWIAAGLAAADSRADLATMSAVGASPATRRRFAGAQAAVVAVVGTCVGVLAGMGVSLALIEVQNSLPADPLPLVWTLSPPWPVLAAFVAGVPVVAAGLVMAFTPARMPLVRRLA